MSKWLELLYWYCTDFCINAANFLGISYIEFNVLLFLLLMPTTLITLIGINLWRYLIRPIIRLKT